MRQDQCGFCTPELVGPGEEVTVVAVAPAGLCGQKLAIPEEIAPYFTLSSAKVDGVEQLHVQRTGWRRLFDIVTGRPPRIEIPCVAFGSRVCGNGFQWPAAKGEISLTVRNRDKSTARRFVASLFGEVEGG